MNDFEKADENAKIIADAVARVAWMTLWGAFDAKSMEYTNGRL